MKIYSVRDFWLLFKIAKFSGHEALQEESESSISGPKVVYKCKGKKTDA